VSANQNRGGAPQVLHVFPASEAKFLTPYIRFLKDNRLEFERQTFFGYGREFEDQIPSDPNVILESSYRRKLWAYMALNRMIYSADKVIVHGLWDQSLCTILSVQPWLLRKCYWVMWGGDFHRRQHSRKSLVMQLSELSRFVVIRYMGHLVTYVKGDIDLVRTWYGARGQHHDCLMYSSNLYKGLAVPHSSTGAIHIQIGNSADPSNEHLEILGMLERFKDDDIKVIAPLSYGDPDYAKQVAARGEEIFGDKFVAITNFLPFDEYLEFLGRIDIALFNHRRQQAMGNIITLLGLGKKVYLNRRITSRAVFSKAGIAVYDNDDFELERIPNAVAQKNRLAVKSNFSAAILKSQWREILK